MTTNNRQKITVLLALSSFLAAHLCFWLLPDVFEIWNAQAVDQLFVFRSSSRQLRPPYDHTLCLAVTSTVVYRYINEEREKMEGLRQRLAGGVQGCFSFVNLD